MAVKIIQEKMASAAKTLAHAIKRGEVAVFPTDTVYGIGCDATNASAVKKVFEAKKRHSGKALPVLVSSLSQIEKFASLSKNARALAKKLMPGPLTLIVPLKPGARLSACGKEKTIAFRISSSALLRKACKIAGVPIVATSANLSGLPPAQSFEDALAEFGGKAGIIVNGGKLKKSHPSTIVDLSSEKPVLVRAGTIRFSSVLKELRK